MLSTVLKGTLKNKPTLKGGLQLQSGSGKDGITPHIGENGNWFIGEEDTGIRAAGMSAYEVACIAGFEGTEEEWLKSLQGKSGIYVGEGEMPEGYNIQIVPTKNSREAATKEYVDNAIASIGSIQVSGAVPGQFLKVAEVDENGVPTVWEVADIGASDPNLELLVDITTEEEVTSIAQDLERPGYFSELFVIVSFKNTDTNTVGGALWLGSATSGKMQAYVGDTQKGYNSMAVCHILLHDDISAYYSFSGRQMTTPTMKAFTNSNLSRKKLYNKFVLATQNSATAIGAGTRAILYGRRLPE